MLVTGTIVPEPATVTLMAVASLFVGRRRKQAPRSDGDFGSDGLGET
jgi:hypothetical protein